MGSEAAAGAARRRLIRRSVAAGAFYPAAADRLGVLVDELLETARRDARRGPPRAIVVPHAGYRYSGPVAASAYATLDGLGGGRVLLLGPSHFVPLRGISVSGATAWETPFGDVRVDDEIRRAAIDAGAFVDDPPHAHEHALEVQLPFLVRTVGDDITILPVAVGDVDARRAADLFESLWPLADLVVVSTDLSHYLDHTSAQRTDRETAHAVVARRADAIPDGAACGVHSLRGTVELAWRRGLRIRLLDLRTSADTAGDPRRVVGYGAFAIG